ncbi:histone arginine methyltransferase prmt4 carm1 [Cystoisospora suis]|uniref:type I protein arginine methyltransferase n=1 Tax=Cystoisospora suis TaxID=483139 RepID=A0A2C6L9T2_9APIC|nr:histone arginine methyltransferase prmt4 carm1 [Cystoisospora suis]
MHFLRKVFGHGGPARAGAGQVYIDLLRPRSTDSRPAVAFQCPLTNTQKRVPLSHVHRLTANRLVCCPSYGSRSELFSSAAGVWPESQDKESGAESLQEQRTNGDESTTATFDSLFGLAFQDAATAEAFLRQWSHLKSGCESSETGTSSSEGARGVGSSIKPGRGHIGKMDAAVVETYFEYYGKMANQMNMLQDTTRTTTYHRAILENRRDFEGKVVMDVGAGSGILSFFAVQAGAKKVYAVEASSMASTIALLCRGNPSLGSRVQVINKPLESIEDDEVPEKVDVLISEPIGTFLFNERMIETYLSARDRFLKPEGKMYPNRCALVVAPFSDYVLHSDVINKCNFWKQTDFCGVDLSNAFEVAMTEQFRQPIVDYIDPAVLVAQPERRFFDLKKVARQSLEDMTIDFGFTVNSPTLIHGLAGWFDVCFDGSEKTITFSTSPQSPPTHWFQTRIVVRQPLAVNPGQWVRTSLHMKANNQQSYSLSLSFALDNTNIITQAKGVDLKDPDYRYYTNPAHSYFPSSHQAGDPQQAVNAGPCAAAFGGGVSTASGCGAYSTNVNAGAVGCYPSDCYTSSIPGKATSGDAVHGAGAFMNPAGEKKSFGLSPGSEGHASASGADADIASANRELAEVLGP